MSDVNAPRLRWPLDLLRDGEFFLLRDPQGITSEVGRFPLALLPILSRFDGEQTVEELATRFSLPRELLTELCSALDSLGFLDTERFRRRLEEVACSFREAPFRDAVFAGRIYPETTEELHRELARYIKNAPPPRFPEAEVVCMISPHIDYRRGWQSYAASHGIWERVPRPDVIFLFGTAHQPARGVFHLTRKPFRGPFGTFDTESGVIDELDSRLGHRRLFDEELLHRTEHSLELQLPFIAHRYQGEPLPPLVPILVGSFAPFIGRALPTEALPTEGGEAGDCIEALAESVKRLRSAGKRVLLMGGIDLSHIGPQFGDPEPVTPQIASQVAEADKEFLHYALTHDEVGLFTHISRDGDKRRVCGFPSLFTMLAVLRRAGVMTRGATQDYRQATDPNSLVSFASAGWCHLSPLPESLPPEGGYS